MMARPGQLTSALAVRANLQIAQCARKVLNGLGHLLLLLGISSLIYIADLAVPLPEVSLTSHHLPLVSKKNGFLQKKMRKELSRTMTKSHSQLWKRTRTRNLSEV